MKSAYEIALERMEKESGPAQKLTDAQRAEIAEIDRRLDAKAAGTRLEFDARLSKAASAEELEQIRNELADAMAAIEGQREKAKESVWNSH